MSRIDGEPEGRERRQSNGFLLLYALAAAGGTIAYMPLLTILLPVRVEIAAGSESVAWLAYIAFAGAIAASLGNILFGWLSDISGNRRGWILAGLLSSTALLVSLPYAQGLAMLVVLLVAWQLCLNMMLGPLTAWAGDVVPDHQKGMLGGLLAFAPALGALSGIIVTIPGMAEGDTRLALVALIVMACVLPILFFGRPKPFPQLLVPNHRTTDDDENASRIIVVRMWLARFLVQIAQAALFTYLYLWLRSISADIRDSEVAGIFGLVLLASCLLYTSPSPRDA